MPDLPDRLALVHEIERLIDAGQRHGVGDEWRELDAAGHGVFHHAGQLTSALDAAER